LGKKYNPSTSKEKVVPGKVYYAWTATNGFVSRYWYDQDPGFFGNKTCFTNEGSYNRSNYDVSKGFDIINTPVLFRIGTFSFAGLVKSWEKNYDSGGLTYNVTIESMDSILDDCHIILDKHIGAIFGKAQSSTYGNPTNWINGGNGFSYSGKIIDGNIPNVFNVYGFLESMGIGDFGGSNRNDNGISAALIIDALSVLTSSVPNGTDPASALDNLNKKAFSPFGRILCKVPQTNETYLRVTPSFNGFGFLPVTYDAMGIERCHFALDLSELPRPPLDFRIQEQTISIMSLIQQITTATGSDFYFETIPATLSGISYNIIKLKTITRSAQPDPRQIEKTIAEFQNAGYAVSSSRIGKEKNNNTSRVMYLGDSQRRLFQSKAYRLAFSQTNYVYEPVTNKFVEFYGNVAGQPAAGQFGKYRSPNFFSTRNPAIVSQLTNKYASLFNIDEDIKNIIEGSRFGDADPLWADTITGTEGLSKNTRVGNYSKTKSLTKSATEDFSSQTGTGARFFPLYRDLISPFFGYKHEDNFEVNTTAGESNVLRRIRPVWMDSWTGQLVVLLDISELPKTTNVVLRSPYADSTMFTITESEIRAAASGFDQYLVYCMGRIFSPDLYKMLKESYTDAGKVIFSTIMGNPIIDQGNAAGQMGQPTQANPSPNTANIDYNIMFSQDFLRDFNKIFEFVKNLSKYYGAQYLVKLPEVMSYRDQQYNDIQIPGNLSSITTNNSTDTIQVYQGSGKIFYNYEIATDGAWEEFGNMIDDCMIVGGVEWYTLSDDNGKIQPLLGYNISYHKDYIAQAICKDDTLTLNNRGYSSFELLEIKQAVDALLQAEDSTCDDSDTFLYPSINIASLSQEDFIIKNSLLNTPDALGNINTRSQKLYQKVSVNPNFAFLDPIKLRNPYAIVNTSPIPLNSTSKFYSQDPNSTVLATASMEDLAIVTRLYGDTTSISQETVNNDSLVRILLRRITTVIGDNDFLILNNANSSTNHHVISPKVAHPFFAAIPIKSNQYCYGPWTNYPDLDKNIIFPDVEDSTYLDNAVENLIGGTKVEVKSEFVPWNYGGMSYLDQAALYEIYNAVQYQQILESATLSIPGLPIFGLGAGFVFSNFLPTESQIGYNNQIYTIDTVPLSYTDKVLVPSLSSRLPLVGTPTYASSVDETSITNTVLNYTVIILRGTPSVIAPIISNITCNISPQNVGTTYSFRTYTQKLGFFNKENSDRLKVSGLNSIKTNKQLSSLFSSFSSQLIKDRANTLRDMTKRDFTTDKFQSGFYGTSPGNILVGCALPFGFAPTNLLERVKDLQSGRTITERTSKYRHGEDPGEAEINNEFEKNQLLGFMKDVRHRTYVGNFTDNEALTELGQSYNLKSAMSWDGIFSPVSFYPTRFNSTYSLLKYTRKECNECNGQGIINEKVYDYKTNALTTQPYPCPYCSIKKVQIGSSVTTTASTSETLPPYIITNSNDINTLLEFNTTSPSIGGAVSSSADTSKTSGLTIPVNMINLQPIVVPYGEFRNTNVQNDSANNAVDRCRHCIAVIARGNIAPKDKVSHNIHMNLKTFFDPETGNVSTENGEGVNADFYPYDILAQFNRVNPEHKKFVMNQRFFGLRGPVILHGWGYDTQGYPVPNASDEPKIVDNYGRAARFLLKVESKTKTTYGKINTGETFIVGHEDTVPDDSNLVYYTKSNGMQIIDTDGKWVFAQDDLLITTVNVSNDLDNTPSEDDLDQESYKNNGDIITKQYEHNGSKWVKKARSKQFYLNWAEKPDLWPVGPIDLRWDENRRVWTINQGSSPYKFVYVTLEEDLIKENDFDETYPAKGFLDDIEYSKDPLPYGYRRLVYIKDKTGYTAPKGVKLLCRYDTDSGFYEPISKPNIIAQGVIDTGNMAKIDMDYAQGNRAIASPILLTSFANPLELAYRQGQKALFTFVRGQWILTSTKQ
jgi:hypothetical protein